MSDREHYIAKLKAKLEEWNADISKLEAKAKNAQLDLKQKYASQIEDLKQQRDHAQDKLQELRSSGEEAWQSLREGAEKAWENLSNALKEAKDRFR